MVDEFGELEVVIERTGALSLGYKDPSFTPMQSGTSQKTLNYDLYVLDYGQIKIKLKRFNEFSKTKERIDLLQNYLFPSHQDAAKKDAYLVLSVLIEKGDDFQLYFGRQNNSDQGRCF